MTLRLQLHAGEDCPHNGIELSAKPARPIVEEVRADLLRRPNTGIVNYGTTLDRGNLKLVDRLRRAYEDVLGLGNCLRCLVRALERK